MTRIAPVIAVLTAGLASGSHEARATDLVDDAALEPAGLVKYWQCPIPLRQGEQISRLYLEDENLYAVTDLGVVYTIDADVGLLRWNAPVTEPPFGIFRPCHPIGNEGATVLRTCVATPKEILVFHRRSGRLLSKMKLPFTPSSPPIADEEAIYIGSVNSIYYSLRVVEQGIVVLEPTKKGLKWYAVVVLPGGRRLYREADRLSEVREWQQQWIDRLGGLKREQKAAMPYWKAYTEGNVKARPAVVKGIAYIPSDGGSLFAVRLSDKKQQWVVRVPGAILTEPLVSKGTIYFGTTARSVYGIDRLLGTQQWQCYLPVPIKRNGTITKGSLYYPGDPVGVYAIDPVMGTLRWAFEQASRFLAEQKDTAYLFQPNDAIYQVSIETGEQIRMLPTPRASLGVSNPRDRTLYLGDPAGRIMCIRPKGVPYLRRATFEQARTAAADLGEGRAAPGKTAAKESQAPAAEEAGRSAAASEDPLRSRSDVPPAVSPKP